MMTMETVLRTPEGTSEKLRIADVILWAGAGITLAMSLVALVLRPALLPAYGTFLAMFVTHLLALLLLRLGKLRWGVFLFVALYFVIVFRTVWAFGGLHVPAILALPPLVLFVGLTTGGRAALLTAVTASAGVMFALGMQRAGWMPHVPAVPPELIAIVGTGVLVISAFMLIVALGVIERSRRATALSARAQRELEERLSQARRVESIGRLAAGVAHDFNNLLTVIYAEAEFIEQQSGASAAAAANILMAAERASALTRQLLAFGRKRVLAPEPLALGEVVDKLSPLFRSLLGSRLTLELALDAKLPEVRADRTDVEQILLNLVSNARDAMPRTGTITIAAGTAAPALLARWPAQRVRPSAGVYLSVHDTGSGIDAQTRDRLFEPFFTTKELGRGTGLGLATVRDIVERMNGAVFVDTQVGHGSTFTVVIPLSDEGSAEGRVPAAEHPAQPAGGQHVLVLDDDVLVTESVVKILRGAGYAVSSARSVVEVQSMVESWHQAPDLLLVDVLMPELTGPELVARLRAKFPKLKVLFMSASVEGRLASDGVLREDVHFIAKPLAPEMLCSKVASVMASPNIGSLGAGDG